MATEPDKPQSQAFLDQYWKDRDGGTARTVREYMDQFPGADDEIAAQFTDLQRLYNQGLNNLVSAIAAEFPDLPAREAPAPEADGETLGPYRLEEEIGRGGQGVVYRATDTRVGRRVAVKVLKGLGPGSEKVLSYFKREAAIASKLDHPGLCPVYDAEVEGGIPYIAMRYVEGETLARRITLTREDAISGEDTSVFLESVDLDEEADTNVEGPPQKASSGTIERPALIRALRLIEKTARALHAAHEAGVIHRDVKPGNVMVTPEGEAVVMDFGLARDDDNLDLQTLTQSGDLFGTPSYMSPEQLTRQAMRLDRRTDVWSLGVMLYECVTLQRPFDAATRESLFHHILMKEPADPRSLNPHLPRDLVTVIQTALEKDRDRRYQTALDLAEELRRIREYEPIKSRPVSALTRLVRWSQRNPALAAMTGAAALILIVGATAATLLALRAEANATTAETNATTAEANAATAEANAATANENLAEWERLADGRRLDDRLKEANGPLWPAVPKNIPAYGAWLEKTAALTAKIPEHEAALKALRARGTYDVEGDRERMAAAYARLGAITVDVTKAEAQSKRAEAAKAKLSENLTPLREKGDDQLTRQEESTLEHLRQRIEAADDAIEGAGRKAASLTAERTRLEAVTAVRSSWSFRDEGDQLRHDKLRDLVAGLRGLLGSASPKTVTVAGIEKRLADATELGRRLRDDDAAAWRRCIEDLATPDDQYTEAVTLAPIPGLVPLGRDRDSNLWEFWHVVSGTRPEWERDAGSDFGKVRLHQSSGAEGVVMVLIPGGTFRMGSMEPDAKHPVGSPNVDDQLGASEGPIHDVSLHPYLLAKHEVTQGQWLRLFANNPSQYQPGTMPGGQQITLRMPATNLDWDQAREACRRWGLVLPTESRWEHACRAGTSSRFFAGYDTASLEGIANIADQAYAEAGGAGFEKNFDDGFVVHAAIGVLRPNRFGLHDVHGNVFEWCLDGYDENAYGAREARGGDGLRVPWQGARHRVTRGGAFDFDARHARSSYRNWGDPGNRGYNLGFRPALSVTTF